MNNLYSKNRKFSRVIVSILSVFVILGMGFPGTGNALAQEPAPHFYASTEHNGIWGADFAPGAQLTFSIYNEAGGNLLWSGDKAANSSGQAWLVGADHPVDLVPGHQVVISMQGTPLKDLVLEPITADLFDLDQGLLHGTAPAGRKLWVGVDFDTTHLGMEVTADATGSWVADFEASVPTNYTWAGAQLFDDDGDATEANPPRPIITISNSNNYLRADSFAPNTTLTFTVYATQDTSQDPLWSDSRVTDENGFAIIWPWEQPLDLVTGNYVTATDGINEKQLILEPVTLDVFDPNTDFLEGTAPISQEGRYVWTWAGNNTDPGCGMGVTADPVSGEWTADFKTIPCDITMDMWGAAQVYDDDGDGTVYHEGPTTPPPPTPYIAVSLTAHWISLTSFLPETMATILVYEFEGASTPVVELKRDTDASGNLYINGWEPFWDLEPGNFVVATDGATTKELLLEYLTLDVFDPANDIVSGHALPGREVGVGAGNANGEQWMTVYADQVSGVWTADYATIGFDVTEDMWAGGHVNDEDGDVTAAHNSGPPLTNLTAFPEWEYIEGWNWPLDASVHLTIDDPATESSPDFEQDQTVIMTPWDPNSSWVTFNFANEYDLKPGDVVTLTTDVVTRTHTVLDLSIEKIDPLGDKIKGMADAGAEVYVWPHATGQQQRAVATAGGNWKVDFSGIFDLVPGESGRSEIRDEFGNSTAVDWYVPKPHFTVFPEWEFFDGYEWPDGASVKITVKGKPECKVTKESWGGFFNGNFAEGCDVAIGDKVTFAAGNTTLTHVVRKLGITAVDPEDNTITGMADPGTTVYVWPHDGWFAPLQTIVDGSGVWQVDLDDVGYDIQPGASGRSEIRDEWGDSTAVDWYVPNPRFEVRDEADSVAGWDWQPNGDVSISVDGSFITTALTDQGGYFNIVMGELVNLIPGSNVEVTNGTNTKVHMVTGLAINTVDVETEFVFGTATPNARIQVEVCGLDGCVSRWEMASDTGNWSADFSIPGDEPGEEQIFDFVPGTWLDSREWDEDGDNTIAGYNIPKPRLTIFPLWQWYDGLDWPNGSTVNITVQDKPACDATKTSWNYFFNGGFSSSCYIEIGDTITFTDGTTSRTHVIRNLAITDIDLKKDTIGGTADPGATVYVWPHDAWFEPLQAIANNSGAWKVDLGDVGYDILEGVAGRAEIRDEFGNATAVDWNLNSRIVVQITDDWFRAEGFAPNTSLKFQIYEAPGEQRLMKSATAQTDSGGSITHWFGDQVDIVPGNQLIVSDGKTTRDIVVEDLAFDVFDTTVGLLQGTAPEPFGRNVSVGIGCWQRDDLTADTVTDELGAWSVDFQTAVPNDFGCVFAWIYDVDGDVSETRPAQIIWSE